MSWLLSFFSSKALMCALADRYETHVIACLNCKTKPVVGGKHDGSEEFRGEGKIIFNVTPGQLDCIVAEVSKAFKKENQDSPPDYVDQCL